MGLHTTRTETFIAEHLPAMITAGSSDAEEAYTSFLGQLRVVMGDTSVPEQSDFDWRVAFDAVDSYQRDSGEKRRAVAATAAKTALLTPDGEVRLHGDGGVFSVVDAGTGQLLAAGRKPSPEVPAAYGCGDPYIFDKIASAALIEKLLRQGTDWGEGYDELTNTRRRLGLLAAGATLHIGMATLHEVPYTADTAGTDRHALTFAASSGRILTPAARLHIVTQRPDVAARLVGSEPHPDDLAGWLDTQSAAIASKAALYGVAGQTHLIELLDPNDPDTVRVDLN